MKPTPSKEKSSTIPEAKENHFPVVAIGASAGGLEAMMELLQYLPEDTGMAFIYVQHLSPDHKSLLSEILSKKTSMVVQEIDDMDKIKPNNLFVIPYNKGIEVTDGHIKLIPRSDSSTAISIDILFSSLAEAQKERVVGIILSGSASDGTQGMKSIKQYGGLTFVQDDTAKFTSMPHSAIAAGVVDFILSPKEIALELARLTSHSFLKLPSGSKEAGIKNGEEDLIENSNPDLKSILNQLHKATGVDFTGYKMSTIKRRIIRRMLLYKIPHLKEYSKLLAKKKEEIDILYQDLLINVTSFFRDTDTHKYLKDNLFPKLLLAKKPGESLRIWVPACATGEEAYSIAMMLLEIQESKSTNTPVQIFATDLSEQAIRRARLGTYSRQEMETVSPKRLQRFFNKSSDGFRVNKAVRDMCVFATHNILQDPPFSRLDFISCCNLFIYLDIPAQKKAINTFHYALNDGGLLMLGKSENITQSAVLFKSYIDKYKIFSRKNSSTRTLPQLSQRFVQQTLAAKNIPVIDKNPIKHTPLSGRAVSHNGIENAIDAVLLAEFMPASVVINHQLEIIQFRGSTDLFLTHPKGKATFNILKMARPEIAFELRNAISKALKAKQRIRKSGIELKINSVIKIISLEIVPITIQLDEDLLLVLFTEQEQAEMYVGYPSDGKANSLAKDRRIKKLEEELAAAYADGIAMTQEHEAFTEELQSANEEVVSSNEELQTLNEELETSKEEIESANEELTTTNQELQTRNDLLNESYDFSEAVIATMHNPMIVLDKSLRVKSASKIFYDTFQVNENETEGLLLYDLGNRQWNIPRLRELLEDILPRNTHFFDFEITHTFPDIGEKIMLLNASRIIQKTNHEELILLAFSDVTEVRKLALANEVAEKKILQEKIAAAKQVKDLAEAKQAQLQNIFQYAPAATAVFEGPELTYILANQAYQKLFHRQAKDILGKSMYDVFPELKFSGAFELVDRVYKTGESFTAAEYAFLIDVNNDGVLQDAYFNFSMEPLKNDSGEVYGVVVMTYDITEQVVSKKKIGANEKQQAFLLMLSDALSLLSDPQQIKVKAMQVLGECLHVSRCYYAEVTDDGKHCVIDNSFSSGFGSIDGTYRLDDFGKAKVAALRRGEVVMTADVANDKTVTQKERDKNLDMQIHAYINVPLIKDNKLFCLLGVNQAVVRHWSAHDLSIVQKTAERTWDAVERAMAEEAQRKSEEKYRTLFTSIDQGFTLCELIRNKKGKAIDLTILEVNPTYEKQTGVTKEMVLGKPLLQVFPSLRIWLETYADVVEHQRPVQFEQYFEDSDRWFAINAYPVEKEKFAILFSDITDRKQAEKLITESEIRFRGMADASPVLIWTLDAHGMASYYNKTFLDFIGASPDDDISDWKKIVHPDDFQLTFDTITSAIAKKTSYILECRLLRADGQWRWALCQGNPRMGINNEFLGFIGSSVDITERKEAETKIKASEKQLREFSTVLKQKVYQRTAQLEEKNVELIKINKELEAFTYISSHDLQEPLRKIQTFAGRILEKENQNLSDKGRQYFNLMQNEALRMKTLIQDLIAFSKLSIAERVFESNDLKTIIEEVKKEFKEVMEEKHAVIEVKEICDVYVIPFQFRQLMHNLISNALKFSNPNIPPHITIESKMMTYKELNMPNLPFNQEYCHIRVADNGIGLEKEFYTKIFEVFQRLHGREEYTGTGIGLAIVKKIVDNHNGLITVTSELNKGASFDIYLPAGPKGIAGVA